MRRVSALLAAPALLLALAGGALTAAADDPKIEFEQYRLANGLEVILHQDRSVPLVAVNVWYHVGSGDEELGKSGFAHLFEHMLFQGSRHVGADKHFETLRRLGATSINGTTNSDRTNYFQVVPSHQLEAGLWIESDRMGYFLPLLNQESLDNQIKVVRNERRQRYDNVPYGRTRFALAAALHPEGHPYRYLTIGKHEDIEGATLEDVRQFYFRWYVPANATLCLAGDFDVDEAKALIDKWFGSFPKSQRPERRAPATPVVAGPVRVEQKDPMAKLRRLDYAWHTPASFRPGDAELDILSHTLTSTGTGRLYRILVHEKQLAQSVSSFQWSRKFSSQFQLSITARSDADLAEIERIVDEELERVRTEPISKAEFDRAVVRQESSFIWGLESLMARAETLQRYNHYVGKPDYITEDLDRFRNSSPQKVMDATRAHLARERRVEVLTVPGDQAAVGSAGPKGGSR